MAKLKQEITEQITPNLQDQSEKSASQRDELELKVSQAKTLMESQIEQHRHLFRIEIADANKELAINFRQALDENFAVYDDLIQ